MIQRTEHRASTPNDAAAVLGIPMDPLAVAESPDYLKLDVGDGWVAEVTTSCDRSADQWRPVLRDLVSDGGKYVVSRRILKDSARGCVSRVELLFGEDRATFVCKQSHARGVFARLARHIRSSPERRNRDDAVKLLSAGVRTPLPIALLEHRSRPTESLLVTQLVPDALDFDRVVSDMLIGQSHEQARTVKRGLIDELADLCRHLSAAQFFHRDFKPSNILVTDWNGADASPRLWLVDLDGIQTGRGRSAEMQRRAVLRLASGLAGRRGVGRTDYLRFLKVTRDFLWPDEADWKSCWRDAVRRIESYNQRSRRRKQGKLDGYELPS